MNENTMFYLCLLSLVLSFALETLSIIYGVLGMGILLFLAILYFSSFCYFTRRRRPISLRVLASQQAKATGSPVALVHAPRYYFLLSMAFIGAFLVALEIRDLAYSFFGLPPSLILGLGSFLLIVISLSWAWNVTVGRPYGTWVRQHPENRRANLYLFLPLLLLITGFFVYSQYASYLEPVSFTATNFVFVNVNGSIVVHADIKVTSEPTTVQVDAAIDGIDDGICGPRFPTNQTVSCIFGNSYRPLVTCAELSTAQNHTVTLFAGFSNSKTITSSYQFTRIQLGCT